MIEVHWKYDEAAFFGKDVLIHHHLGLGDHIVLNGLVNYIAEKHDKNIFLLCKQKYFENVKRLYEGNTKVTLVTTGGLNEYKAAEELINQKLNNQGIYFRLGHELYDPTFLNLSKIGNFDCGEVFYYIANIPYQIRYDMFRLKYNQQKNEELIKKLNPNKEPFIFIHDDPIRGYNIYVDTDKKCIRNDVSFGIFDYEALLRQADEIHLMSSSFYCFVESLHGLKAKMFMHHKVRGTTFGKNERYKWQLVT